MAKKTKDSNLSIEERLEQALIPNWDEPYKLPQNWCWVKLDSISEILNGYAFKSSLYTENGIRIIRITNVQDGFIEDEKPVFYPFNAKSEIEQYILKNNDLLMSLTGNVGRVALMKEEFLPAALNQRVACLRMKSPTISTKYLFYCLLQKQFIDDCSKSAKGSAQLNMSTEWLKGYSIPLPPTHEQLRIVEQIESLFSKLDEAKEKAQEVVDGFETRKAAILHKAFSGELTAKWREEHQHSIHEWSNWSIDELCFSLKYGTAKKSKSEGPVVVIRMGNLQQGEIDWTDLAYTDDPEDIEKYKLFPGDVLFNRTNSAALVGKTSIYRGEYPAIFAGYLIKLDYDRNNILGDYLNYALNTTTAKEYCNSVKTDGVNQSNINAKKIGAFVIPVAPLKEQEEIVRIIKELWRKEKAAKDAAESVIEQIDAMKKAILARAFRGELGTNDPSEESAIVLVKSILSRDTKSTADRSNSNTHYLSTQKSNQTRYRVRGSGLGRTSSSIVGSKGMAMSKQTIGKALFAIQGVHQWKPNTNAHVVAGVRPIKTPVKKQIVSRGKTVHEREILKVLCESVETPVHIGKLITVGSKWADKMNAIRSLERSGVIVRIGKDKFKIK